MAKISANGARKVCSVAYRIHEGRGVECTFTLCTDGRVLRKVSAASGYKLWAQISDETKRTEAFLRERLEARGFVAA
jgi:hypothetical protein